MIRSVFDINTGCSFLVTLIWVAAVACVSTSIGTEKESPAPERKEAVSLETLREMRSTIRFRERRIIVNNDGNDKVLPPYTIERFLESRTSGLEGTQVDSIFYCTGVPMLYTHRSKIAAQLGVGDHADAPNKQWVSAFNEQDTDSLEIVTNWGREHDKEIFWSIRLNDRHDSGSRWKHLITDWKRKNPELTMGTEGEGLPDNFERGHNSWSLLRYDRAEVRDTIYSLIEEVCQNYDIDGIELDFWRHPAYFPEPLIGLPVPREKKDDMTKLWKRVRRMTEAVGMERGKPFLIAIKIPDSMDYCEAMGLDVKRWLEEDLVDLVIGADYFKLEPWENLVATGRRFEVPVYACFEIRRIEPGISKEGKKASLKVWRGEAYNAWRSGVDGIYLMNRFDSGEKILYELGDPELLEALDRVDQTSYYNPETWSKPQTWVPDGMKYFKEPRQ